MSAPVTLFERLTKFAGDEVLGTDFRTLRYVGKGPLIQKPIKELFEGEDTGNQDRLENTVQLPDGVLFGNSVIGEYLTNVIDIPKAVNTRVTDTIRVGKLLAQPAGLKFLANLTLLEFLKNSKLQTTRVGINPDTLQSIGRSVGTAGQAAFTSVIQTLLSGTGINLPYASLPSKALRPKKYTDKPLTVSNVIDSIAGIGDSSDSTSTSTFYIVPYLNSKHVKIDPTEVNNPAKGYSKGMEKSILLNKYIGRRARQYVRSVSDLEKGGFVDFRRYPSRTYTDKTLTLIQENTLDKRFGLPKVNGNTINNTSDPLESSGAIDVINGQDILQLDTAGIESYLTGNKSTVDIIPFTIQVIEPGQKPYFIVLRAYLEDFSDNFTGGWSPINYLGRSEKFYTYKEFDRSISFKIKIAALSREELIPLYNKLNYLAGSTAGTYGDASSFVKGVLNKVTLGDYFKNQPGFFTSIGVSWNTTYPWEIRGFGQVDTVEIGGGTYTKIPILPTILDISFEFKPIHDFVPQLKQNFIYVRSVNDEVSRPDAISTGNIKLDDVILEEPDIDVTPFESLELTQYPNYFPPPLPELQEEEEGYENIDQVFKKLNINYPQEITPKVQAVSSDSTFEQLLFNITSRFVNP